MSFKETEVGRIPEDWEVDNMENSLEEIIDYRGKTPEKSEKGIPTLSAKSVKDGYIDYSRAYFISKETYNKFMVRGFPKKGDILLTTEAPLGLVARLDRENIAIAQRILTLRGKKDYLVNEYLQYYLMSVVGQHQLTSKETGTTVKGIKQKEFRKCLIPLPPLKEQKAIAHILSTLDEKIEINNKINKNLESMAQEIFKHWFVDFEFPDEKGNPYKSSGGVMVESEMGIIPEGWKVKEIEDFIEIVSKGTTPRKKDIDNAIDENIIKFLKVKDISDDGIISISSIEYIPSSIHKDQLKRSILKHKDILLSIAGTIGRVSYVTENLINANINQAISFIRLRDIKKHFLLIIYKLKSEEFQNSIKSKVVQGVQANISLTVIKKERLVTPDNKNLKLFNNTLNPIFKEIENLHNENETLVNLRNTLLPKLMSGELRVPLDNDEPQGQVR